MNQPKTQADHPPAEGASPDQNPTGTTPRGVPDGMDEHDAKGHPNSDRQNTETATQRIEKG